MTCVLPPLLHIKPQSQIVQLLSLNNVIFDFPSKNADGTDFQQGYIGTNRSVLPNYEMAPVDLQSKLIEIWHLYLDFLKIAIDRTSAVLHHVFSILGTGVSCILFFSRPYSFCSLAISRIFDTISLIQFHLHLSMLLFIA
jgi:hypothetical protein